MEGLKPKGLEKRESTEELEANRMAARESLATENGMTMDELYTLKCAREGEKGHGKQSISGTIGGKKFEVQHNETMGSAGYSATIDDLEKQEITGRTAERLWWHFHNVLAQREIDDKVASSETNQTQEIETIASIVGGEEKAREVLGLSKLK